MRAYHGAKEVSGALQVVKMTVKIHIDNWFDFMKKYSDDDMMNCARRFAFDKNDGRMWMATCDSIYKVSPDILFAYEEYIPIYLDGVYIGYGGTHGSPDTIYVRYQAEPMGSKDVPEDGEPVYIVGYPVRWRVVKAGT